jgi:hypothetical protein
MHETVNHFSRFPVARQQAMTLGQKLFEPSYPLLHAFRVRVVVVEVDLDFAESLAAQFGQTIQLIFVVLFQREEESVSGRPAIAVPKLAELPRVFLEPALDPRQADRRGGLMVRLKMIGNAQKQMHTLARGRLAALPSFNNVSP